MISFAFQILRRNSNGFDKVLWMFQIISSRWRFVGMSWRIINQLLITNVQFSADAMLFIPYRFIKIKVMSFIFLKVSMRNSMPPNPISFLWPFYHSWSSNKKDNYLFLFLISLLLIRMTILQLLHPFRLMLPKASLSGNGQFPLEALTVFVLIVEGQITRLILVLRDSRTKAIYLNQMALMFLRLTMAYMLQVLQIPSNFVYSIKISKSP